MMSGSVVLEKVFNLPGLGALLVDAITARDYAVVQGVVMMLSLIHI